MTKKQEGILLAEVVVLKAEVERLREQISKIQVVHNHYHFDAPQCVPLSPPSFPLQPLITWGESTGMQPTFERSTRLSKYLPAAEITNA